MTTQPPGDQLTTSDPAAISDLTALAAELPAHGLTTQLDPTPPPRLILTHPNASEPQHVRAEGEFFTWHNSTGHAPFGLRHHPPALNASGAGLVMQAVIINQLEQEEEPGTR